MGLWDAIGSMTKDKDNPVGLVVATFAVILFTLLGMFVFMAMPFVFTALSNTGRDVITGKQPVQSLWRNCYDFKEIKGELYKVDQCSGQLSPYTPPK